METITYSQVQDLVARLQITKLPLAHSRLSLSERRRIMEQQAQQMVAHYEQTAVEHEVMFGT